MITETKLDSLLAHSNPLPMAPDMSSADKSLLLKSICDRQIDDTDLLLETVKLHDSVTVEFRGQVAVLNFDDGNANLLTIPVLQAFIQAIDLCEADSEIGAIAIIGREGFFSAGLERSIFFESPDTVNKCLGTLAELLMRLYESSTRVAVACTGHAIAAGALLLLAADVRIGTTGQFKIGMNEVSIGITLPSWATEFARQRLSNRAFQRATATGHLYPPVEAIDAGFVDQLVDGDVISAVISEAQKLAILDPISYGETTLSSRGECLSNMRALIKSSGR